MEAIWILVDDSFEKSCVEDWVFQIADTSESTLPGGQDIVREPLVLRCLFLHPKDKLQSPRFLLLLGNTSRHLCQCCGYDPHVNVFGATFLR